MALKDQRGIRSGIKAINNINDLPPLKENATSTEVLDYLNKLGTAIPGFLGDKADVLTPANFVNPAYDFAILSKHLRARRQELMLKAIEAQTDMSNLPPLPKLIPPATEITSDQIRTYLINYGNALGFNEENFAYNNENLNEKEAEQIRDVINNQRNLLIPQAIKAVADIKLLPAFSETAKTDGAQVRKYLAVNGKNLKCNPDGVEYDAANLPDEVIDTIILEVNARRNILILAKITAITEFAKFPAFESPANEAKVRDYLERFGMQLGLCDAPIKYTEHNLPTVLALNLEEALIKKQTQLLIQHLKANTGLALLPALADDASADEVYKYLADNKTALNLTATYDGKNLYDFEDVKQAIISQRNQLIMAGFANLGQAATDLQFKALSALARAPSKNAIRAVLADTQYSALFAAFGLTAANCGDDDFMSRAEAEKLRAMAEGFVKGIIGAKIVDAISQIDSKNPKTTEIDELFKVINCGTEPEIRAAVHNNPDLGTIDISDKSGNPYWLLDDDAKLARNTACVKAMQIVIAQDTNYQNFVSPPDVSKDKPAFKAHILQICKTAKPPLNGITQAHLDRLDDTQLQVISAALKAQQFNLVQGEIDNIIKGSASYPLLAYGKLQALIGTLAQDQQIALLADNGKLLKELIAAETKHELLDMARICGITNHAAVTECLDEIAKRKLYAAVNNRELAAVLVTMKFKLTDKAIDALNKVLFDQRNLDLTDPTQLQTFKDEVKKVLATPPSHVLPSEINNFIIELDNNIVSIDESIKANVALISGLNLPNLAARDKAIYDILVSVHGKAFTPPIFDTTSDFQAIQGAINTSKTYKDFIINCEAALKAAPKLPPDPLQVALQKLQPNFEACFTEERFELLQKEMEKEKLSGPNAMDELEDQKTNFEKLAEENKAFRNTNKALIKQLEAIAGRNTFERMAVDPAVFDKEKAKLIVKQVVQIGVACDELCRGLRERLKELELLAAAIPDEQTLANLEMINRWKMNNHKSALHKEINRVRDDLRRYENVHLWLHGDPTKAVSTPSTASEIVARYGVIKVVEDAAMDKPFVAATLPDDWEQSQDIDPANVKSYIKSNFHTNAVDQGTTTATFNGTVKEKSIFSDAGVIAPGKIRIHGFNKITKTDHITGKVIPIVSGAAYTEERGPDKLVSTPDGPQITRSVTMAIHQPPQAMRQHLSPAEELELKKSKVIFYTNMAVRMLSQIGQVPSEDNPITLRGANPEQLGMLWTALLELGKVDKNFAFDKSAIVVDSVYFDPKSQKGLLGGHAKDSYYNQYFADDVTGSYMKTMKKEAKSFYTQNMGGKKVQDQSKKEIESLRNVAEGFTDSNAAVTIDPLRKPR